MSIRVKAEKYVKSDGTKGLVIKEASALERSKLPEMYVGTSVYPHCYSEPWYGESSIVLVPAYDENYIYIRKNDFFSEEEFERIIAYLRKCGDNLKKVNETLKHLREEWQGEVEIII